MYCYLYEALDDNGQPCFLFDAANEDALHAQLRALPDPDKTKWTARFYRRLYADTPEEMDALKLEIEDKWVRETSPETESRATQGVCRRRLAQTGLARRACPATTMIASLRRHIVGGLRLNVVHTWHTPRSASRAAR